MSARAATELNAAQCREVAAWIQANREELPAPVRTFLGLHETYLAAGEGDSLRRALEAAWRELRRALHLTPSSEKRRSSGSPLDGIPPPAVSKQAKLEAQLARGRQLADWHRGLGKGHDKRIKRLKKRLAKMSKNKTDDGTKQQLEEEEVPPLDELELTEEERAETKAATGRFIEHLLEGKRADPAMKSASETLMPGCSVLVHEERVSLPAVVPKELAGAQVVKTHHEPRVRYDFAVTLTRIELDVEKKVVVDRDGERRVFAPSTLEYGPPRY